MRYMSALGYTALFTAFVCLLPESAHAYIGPGAGLSAIGAVLAAIAAIFLAIFGFIWYPMKRLLRAIRKSKQAPDEDSAE